MTEAEAEAEAVKPPQNTEFVDSARKEWSSETAFVASMTAAAVGLGNLWRFPYIMGENGGGAFVVAYLLALVGVAHLLGGALSAGGDGALADGELRLVPGGVAGLAPLQSELRPGSAELAQL